MQETGIKESDWISKYWLRWGDALVEAGYSPNTKQTAFDADWLIEQFIGLIREVGRYPLFAEIRMKARNEDGFPSHNTFRRFGRNAQFAEKIIEYCKARDGYTDVIEICTPIAAEGPTEPAETSDKDDFGYVYLIRSGRYYKIGRSNSIGRREYELALQLPEKAKTVHVIRTDDPVGIEAYWHQRFANRRKNGEWFLLDSKDVNAFKRRKFM